MTADAKTEKPDKSRHDAHPIDRVSMWIEDLVTPARVRRLADVSSRKRLLEQLANMLASAEPSLTASEILDALRSRERLGSTAVGDGSAIPRGRINGLAAPLGAFVQLANGIDYGSGEADAAPVDQIFALLVPAERANDCRGFVDSLSDCLADPAATNRLRATDNDSDLYQTLCTLGCES